jgi:hypothetical protein
MLECFQNVLRHGQANHECKRDGVFAFIQATDYFLINTINMISRTSVDSLKSLLDQVNDWSAEEKKSKYLEIMEEGDLSENGGAGLGLIELSRKSGNDLKYEMEWNDDDLSCRFHQQVSLTYQHDVFFPDSIAMVKSMDKKMENRNQFLLYKGELSVASIEPMLEIVAKLYSEEKAVQVDEMMHDISIIHEQIFDEHYKNGLLIIGMEGDQPVLQIVVEFNADKREALKEAIERRSKIELWMSKKSEFQPWAACALEVMSSGKDVFLMELHP